MSITTKLGTGMTLGMEAAVVVSRRARNRWHERRLSQFPVPRKLHLGCGPLRLDGWVNVDARPLPSVDLVWDLRAGLPGAESSAAFIYCEHFLEHLSDRDGVGFLSGCRHVLHPGGVLRIAMPSLDVILDKAMSGRWRDQAWLTLPEHQGVATRAEMLNMVFREWGHRWLYDREELERRVREAGFAKLAFPKNGESEHRELRGRESRPDSLLICEVTKE